MRRIPGEIYLAMTMQDAIPDLLQITNGAILRALREQQPKMGFAEFSNWLQQRTLLTLKLVIRQPTVFLKVPDKS